MFTFFAFRSLAEVVIISTMCLAEQTLDARLFTAVNEDLSDFTAPTLSHFL